MQTSVHFLHFSNGTLSSSEKLQHHHHPTGRGIAQRSGNGAAAESSWLSPYYRLPQSPITAIRPSGERDSAYPQSTAA